MFFVAASSGPNWAEVVLAISTGVLSLGVVVAVVQLGLSKRDRHLQWIFEIGRRWDEDKLAASRVAMRALDPDELAKKTGEWLTAARQKTSTPELDREMAELMRLPDFFEDVALMVKFGRPEPELVWQSLSGPLAQAWNRWKPAVEVYREFADAEAFTEFEKLAEGVAKYERERNTLVKGTLQISSFRMEQLAQRLVSYAVLLLIVSIVLLVSVFTQK